MSADIPAIRARLEVATPGPWGYPFSGKNVITTPVDIDVTEADWGGDDLRDYLLCCRGDRNAWRAADAEFIAHAPEDIRELLAEVERLRDAIPDALHPEFGTEWREPDGIIWKAVHAVEVERDEARAEVERSQAITLQWTNFYERMHAAGAELLADNARLAEKVARVESACEYDDVLDAGEYDSGRMDAFDAVLASLADPTTEATT